MIAPVQICTSCGEEKLLSEFYRHAGRKSGFASECKVCDKKRSKAWVALNRGRQRQIANRWKTKNKPQISASSKEGRLKKIAADPNYRQKERLQTKAWRKSNPEKAALIAKRAYEKAWALDPVGAKARAHLGSLKRDERINAAGGDGYTAADIRKQHKHQKGKCWWCAELLGKKYHIDHLIPLAKLGPHDRCNIVLACAPCNLSKGSKMPHEFAGRLL